jgi:DNA-binding SARP family transcriptional activator
LAVLGPPEVFHDESRLTFALRKAQALLLYLAVEGGMHSRSKLAALLWPDSEPHDARTSLRNALASEYEELKNTEMYDRVKEALTLMYTWLAFPFL